MSAVPGRETYTEPPRSIPVVGRWEVVVCGGGTSGFPAAVAAARMGAKTLVLEHYGFLGGVPATCIMPCWHGFRTEHSGMLAEFGARVAVAGPGPNPFEDNHMEPESVKRVALEMTREAGADIRLHSTVADVVAEDGVVRGVVVQSRAGRREAIMADRIVDATGDGTVAVLAGAEWMPGPEGKTQPSTLRFTITGVDFARYFAWIEENLRFYYRNPAHPCTDDEKRRRVARCRERALAGKSFYMEAVLTELAEGKPEAADLPAFANFGVSSIRPGEISINGTRVEDVICLDPDAMTKAEIACRTQAHGYARLLRNHVPGFESSRIGQIGAQVGVRESRRIVGDYVLTEADCRAGARFADSIFLARHVAFDLFDRGHVTESFAMEHGVPYRCLLPKGIENMLVTGRAASADHAANSTIRQMIDVFSMGTAAGLAAALSVRHGVTPRALPYEYLRDEMERVGLRYA